MTQPYRLIENRISMEAGNMKNEKKHIVSFRKPCFLDLLSFSFLSRLGKSGKKLFLFLFVCFFVAYKQIDFEVY